MSEAKKRLVQIWLTKAEHDLMSAHVLAAQCPPLLDTAVYHCQQAAEKVVKGFLVFCDQAFDRVHDIEVLVRLAMPYETRFVDWLDAGRRPDSIRNDVSISGLHNRTKHRRVQTSRESSGRDLQLRVVLVT